MYTDPKDKEVDKPEVTPETTEETTTEAGEVKEDAGEGTE